MGSLALTILAAVMAQRAQGAQPAAPPPISLKTVAERIRDRIETSAASSLEVEDEVLFSSDVLARFYQERAFRPAWIGPEGPLALAEELLGAIGEADQEGLHPEDYHLRAARGLLDRGKTEQGSGGDSAPRVLADLALTDAFLVYGAQLAVGRVHPETIDNLWRAKIREIDMVAVLEEALSRGAVRSRQRSTARLTGRHGSRRLPQPETRSGPRAAGRQREPLEWGGGSPRRG